MASAHTLLAFMLFCVQLVCVTIAESSSLSSYWQHELPYTGMPVAFEKLASPLSASDTKALVSQMQAGTLQASPNKDLCTSAGIYCSEKAGVVVGGTQPRVCIPPFFFYTYAVLPCRQTSASAYAVRASEIFISQSSLIKGHTVQLPDTSNDLKGLKFLPVSATKFFPSLEPRNLPDLAKLYGVEKDSDMEFEMENTLAYCSDKSEHEVRACVSSGEGMVSFVTHTIGHNAVVYAPSATPQQQATIVGISTVTQQGEKVVACHDMKFPSLLYGCHMTQTAQLMDVSVKLANGDVVQMPIVCHMDTSYWNPSHIAFQALNVEPGKSSICHWFPQNSFIFVPSPHM